MKLRIPFPLIFFFPLLAALLLFPILRANAADTVIYINSTASTTWTVPSDWNNASNTIACIGAGGNGGQNSTIHLPAAGGGGGAYAAISNQSLTPGVPVNINIASGGSGATTYVDDNSSSMVLGCGAGGNGNNVTVGAAGTVVAGTGSSGGAGGAVTNSAGRPASGGGSAAGPSGAGLVGGIGGTATNNGGGGGGGSNAGAVGVAGGGNGGAGGNGHGGTGGGTGGTTANGGDGTVNTGGGGGGGDGGSASIDAFNGGAGAIDQSLGTSFGAGGGGGGGGGANNTNHLGGNGGGGGAYGGGGGGGGLSGASQIANGTGGAGGQGLIVVTYTPISAPSVPGTPTYSSVTQTTLTVSWTIGTGADYYSVDRSPDGVSFSEVATTTSLSYNDSGLAASTAYYYQIYGVNAGGSGPTSASSSVTTLAASAPADSGFIVEDGILGGFGGYASSSDFQIVSGGTPFINNDAASLNFSADTGPVNYSDFTPESLSWRWYDDANDETPTSPLSGENSAPSSIATAQIIKLRLNIEELSGLMGAENFKLRLQFAQSSDFTASPGFVDEAGSCSASSTWCYATSTGGNDNDIISTAVLSTSDACSGGIGSGCGTHNTSGISTSTLTQNASATTEYEFTIVADGALTGSTYFFRAINTADGTAIPIASSSSYPSLVTQGSTLTFSVTGLPQSTSTNGVTTNVSTTATGIPFGALTIGTSTIAAQRLYITTDAANGYEIYTAQDQQLTDTRGDKVPGVVGTNPSPLSWLGGCVTTSLGCFGYHAGSPVLAGGSTRFAANDSYAALTSTIAEVGYGGSPAASSTMDMVYRIQIGGTQGTGAYQNNIIYVVAPSF